MNYISVLCILQLGPKKTVSLNLVMEKWADLALPKEQFDDLVRIGSFGGEVEWNKFFALCASALGEVSLKSIKTNKTITCIFGCQLRFTLVFGQKYPICMLRIIPERSAESFLIHVQILAGQLINSMSVNLNILPNLCSYVLGEKCP